MRMDRDELQELLDSHKRAGGIVKRYPVGMCNVTWTQDGRAVKNDKTTERVFIIKKSVIYR